jgi:hypothetical protein
MIRSRWRSALLEQYCFRRWTGEYLDDKGQRLPGPVERCGDWGLSSYLWLDDQIADKLGIPVRRNDDERAPMNPDSGDDPAPDMEMPSKV